MTRKRTVVIGLLGVTLDAGREESRWQRWRPTVSLCQHDDFVVDRLELLHSQKSSNLAQRIEEDIQAVSPETHVQKMGMELNDPWDFEEVYSALHDFSRGYVFDTENEDYLIHITTGTHVAQICLFLLTESRHFPAKLIQTSPPRRKSKQDTAGNFQVIDLDLSRYDRLATRFEKEQLEGLQYLKSGIDTRNDAFNHLIQNLERVAIRSVDPILLCGPTGAGKSQLARKIFELKKSRRQVDGEFVEINCATLRGDQAMSALFGHVKGAFTGALSDRKGLLKAADQGILFLDEIGELGLDEQAMLLRAIEEKTFLPMGSDDSVTSNFQLLAGTNRDLKSEVTEGKFREDLLARINIWTFHLPGLKERREDIEPNLEYELEQFTESTGSMVRFNKEAREAFLSFATSNEAKWSANFRDLNAALTRMATLAPAGRINLEVTKEEIGRLKRSWSEEGADSVVDQLEKVLDREAIEQIDRFDRAQLADVIQICLESSSLSEAGRQLFNISRSRRKSTNDSDRLRKYLAKFGLDWKTLQAHR